MFFLGVFQFTGTMCLYYIIPNLRNPYTNDVIKGSCKNYQTTEIMAIAQAIFVHFPGSTVILTLEPICEQGHSSSARIQK